MAGAFAWIAGTDCALVTGLLVVLVWRERKRLNGPQIAFMSAQVLFLILCAATIDWDLSHNNALPGAQFPFNWRLVLSIPALLLSNYAVWRLSVDPAWPFTPPPGG